MIAACSIPKSISEYCSVPSITYRLFLVVEISVFVDGFFGEIITLGKQI
jgi:hypothetical protein